MVGTDDLTHVLRRLKLSGVLQTLDLRQKQAADDNLDPSEFLFRVLTDELERRDGKKLKERLDPKVFRRIVTASIDPKKVDAAVEIGVLTLQDLQGAAEVRESPVLTIRRETRKPAGDAGHEFLDDESI